MRINNTKEIRCFVSVDKLLIKLFAVLDDRNGRIAPVEIQWRFGRYVSE